MTYPLVARFTTHVPGGGGDDQTYLWNMWWVKRSLVDLVTNPFYTDHIFYPYKVGLSLHAYVFLNGVLSIPLQYFMGLVAINNLFLVLSFVLSGYGAFLLADYFVNDRRAAFLAGVVFAFCPFKMAHFVGQVNYSMTQWMPLYVFFLFKAFDGGRGSVRNALAAGVMLGLNYLTEAYFFIFMVLLTLIYLVYYLVSSRGGALASAGRLSLVAAGSVPFILPQAFFFISDMVSGRLRSVPPAGDEGTRYVVDLLGFFSVSPENPLLGGLSLVGYFTAGFMDGPSAFIGFCVLLLALLGWRKTRLEEPVISFWVLSLLVFAVLSLGPYPHVMGKVIKIPLPFNLFKHVPVLDNLRCPSRFSVVTMLSLSVMAAFGARYMIRKVRHGRILYFLAVSIILLEYAVLPVRMFDSSIPPVYREIASDTRAESVLEVPFFLRDGFNYIGTPMEAAMHFQSVHQKKSFSGFVSRLDREHIFLSFLNLPLIRNIALLEMGLPLRAGYVEADRKLGRVMVDLFGIGYVIVHKGHGTDKAHQLLKYALAMKKIHEDERLVVYRTVSSPPGKLTVDAGSEQSIPFLMRGWINGQRDGDLTYAWSTGRTSTLLLNLRRGIDHDLSLRMRPHEGLRDRTVGISLNKMHVATLRMKEGWETYRVTLPGNAAKTGLNSVTFTYEDTVSTEERFGGEWADGAATYYLRKMYLPNQKETETIILDWEQDNAKFLRSPVSVALDYLEVSGKTDKAE
jgi:hypothetical protein